MCLYSVQVRGITVCGRRVYRTDTGVKVGFQGPTVSLDEACNDLNASKSAYLRESCIEIDRKMTERQQREIEAANVEDDIDAAAVMQRSQNTWPIPDNVLSERYGITRDEFDRLSQTDSGQTKLTMLALERGWRYVRGEWINEQPEEVSDMRDFENN